MLNRFLGIAMCVLVLSLATNSQTTYHFHKETASSGYDLLSVAGPDAAAATLSTTDLKSRTGSVWIANWASAVGVPNKAGVVRANSTYQFSVWMKKSANFGTIYPAVQVGKVDSNLNATVWATAVSTTQLTTTLTKITFSLTLSNAQTLVATDRWLVEVGVNIPSGGSTTHSVTASFSIEGTLNGNYDSTASIPIILTSISISPQNPSLPLGLGTQLTATANFSDGSTQDLTKTATWTSSQQTVATISSVGVATSQAQGATTITAASSGVTGSTTVTVSAPSLLNVAILPSQALIPPGYTQQLTATANYSDGTSQDVTSTAIWVTCPQFLVQS